MILFPNHMMYFSLLPIPFQKIDCCPYTKLWLVFDDCSSWVQNFIGFCTKQLNSRCLNASINFDWKLLPNNCDQIYCRIFIILNYYNLFFYHRIIVKMLKLVKILKRYQAQNETLSSLFFKTLSRHPTKTAILFEDQKWSFQDLENYSNKVANLFLKLGLKHNDTVALFMTNCPE